MTTRNAKQTPSYAERTKAATLKIKILRAELALQRAKKAIERIYPSKKKPLSPLIKGFIKGIRGGASV